jgi:hypothetical protein
MKHPAADSPVDPPPQTGDRVVDAELRLVADAARKPVDEHVEVYARAQRTLQDRLSDLDG